MKKHNGCEIVPFPRIRQFIMDSGRLAHHKHTIHGLIEVDVTTARQRIRANKEKTGESLSFTAFILTCLGRAVGANKCVQAYRNWRNQLVIFDDVDVVTFVEVEVEGRQFPLGHVLRAVNRRTCRELHDEIRAVQARPEQSPNARRWHVARWFLLLPAFMRGIIYRVINRNPQVWKQQVGTVSLTTVGMFGTGGGWGMGFSAHTLGIILGGISQKPVVIEGRIEIRECLSLTVDFDHDIVDGAPAARFMRQFKELIESGYGLPDQSPESAPQRMVFQ
ncbi:MAG TPA: 2-oxo acid dehydrogenase subunit E2 [Blastocatellia bacterium]|nr:2-oxo acid dehydrogenase subunit E2 [Blastocatellia bacterium]